MVLEVAQGSSGSIMVLEVVHGIRGSTCIEGSTCSAWY